MRERAKLEWVVVLRGVAALWVFAYHIWLALGGLAFRFWLPFDFSFGLRSIFRAGYQGVDLFFVLSGFVIAWPYVAARQTDLDRYQVADFYQRRYLRVAPVYYVTLVVAMLLISAGWLVGTVDPWALAAHVLFAQNFVPKWVASVRGVYWTLPTEIHFYLVFPLLLRLLDVDRPLRLALALVAGAIGYRWLLAWLALRHGIWFTWTAAYLPGRIDQFGCGMAAACWVANLHPGAASVRKSTVVLAGVLALAALVLVARNASVQLDSWFVLGPTIAGLTIACFIASLGVYAKQQPERSSDSTKSRVSRMLSLLGSASLSIYLWHTFCIDLALVATVRWGLGATAKAMLFFGAIPVVLAISVLSYRAVEAPIVAFSKSPAWRSRVRSFVACASARFRGHAISRRKRRAAD